MNRLLLPGRFAAACAAGVLILASLAAWQNPARTADAAPDQAAVDRARATVRLLDDLHKGYVVTITDTYVKAQESIPAARIAKKVFKHMEAQGHGSGRLLDATGDPLNKANLPHSDFEKAAVKAIQGGKPYFDQVGQKDGKPVLRAATIVPAVMKQCITCHAGRKEGALLGALVYEVPIK